ncbi:MAG: VCBS repeat-containing protein [Planctomycetes bacterium]|nr:VCBS repeat-containing protein [Planctomycetota bacterium]
MRSATWTGTANPGQQNRLYLNDGAGRFSDATATRMPVVNDVTTSVVFGDVDGDGDLDLVIGNIGQYFKRSGYGGEQNRLYLNDGTGTFTDATAARMPVIHDRSTSLALRDVDGDGDLDLAIGNLGQDRLYLNDGSGTFTAATATRMPIDEADTHAVALADVDGDRDLDLVIANGLHDALYLNAGAGTFVDATPPRMPVTSSTSVVLGDVDGDGDLDLVLGNQSYSRTLLNRLLLNDGRGRFTAAPAATMPTSSSSSLAFGDVDRDGDLDLLLVSFANTRLFVNNGSGTFRDVTATQLPATSDYTCVVAAADVDRDGDLDLVIGNVGQDRLYLNDGSGRFTDATAARMPTATDSTCDVATGDVDGDGDLDLVLGRSGQDRLYLNDGSGTFTDATASRMPVESDSATSLALGDVDRDGDLDLVIGTSRYPGGSQSRLYLNDGAGTFTDATAVRMPVRLNFSTSIALGDLDGDGDLDLVIGNSGRWPNGEQDRLYLNDGTGTFTDATPPRLPVHSDFTFALALGDVDADGDLDIVFGNAGKDRLLVNLERQLEAPYLLRAGHPYPLEVYSRHGPSRQADGAIVYLSTVRLSVPLPPFGILGIDPMAPLAPVLIPQPAGVGVATWNVPSIPSLAGVEVFAQALFVRWPLDLRLSNVTADIFLR